jgi:hypothetical protein
MKTMMVINSTNIDKTILTRLIEHNRLVYLMFTKSDMMLIFTVRVMVFNATFNNISVIL